MLTLLICGLLSIHLQGNSLNGEVATATKELSPTVRPFIELAPFKKLKCVTVSEYHAMSEGKPVTTRVYRFTYPAKYADEARKWQTLFPTKDGWAVDSKSDQRLVLARDVKDSRVAWQALVLGRGKFVFDAKAKARTRRIDDKGFVTVSFNETLLKP